MNHDCLHLDTIAYKFLPQDGKPFYLINQTVGGTTAFILSIINKIQVNEICPDLTLHVSWIYVLILRFKPKKERKIYSLNYGDQSQMLCPACGINVAFTIRAVLRMTRIFSDKIINFM